MPPGVPFVFCEVIIVTSPDASLDYFRRVTFRLWVLRPFPPTMSAMNNRSAQLGTLLVCIFALPFLAFGLFALSTSIRQLITGEGNGSAALGLVFGFVFSGIGLGLMFAVVYGRKRLQRQQRLQAEHPAEPWLWRDDWAQGHIASKTRTGVVFYWVFALFWNGVSFPILYFMRDALEKKGPIVYVSLLFPLIGIFLFIHAIRQTIALFEFGKTFFDISSLPGVVGRHLKGTIQARLLHPPEHGVQLRLSCVNRVVSGSGDSQSTSEKILWRDELSLSPGQLYPGPTGTSIPVDFRIPWDAQPTEKRDARNEILWLLEAMADVPGVNYHDVFEVPVFRTRDTPSRPQSATTEVGAIAHSIERPVQLSVQVRETGNGTEFYFPAARNRTFAMSTSAFMLVFSAITYFLSRSKAPFIFPLAFGFFSLLLLHIAVQMWLGTSRVIVGNGVLSVQSGLAGGGKIQQIPFAEISSISDRITAQQGSGTGTPYYDIELSLRNGKRVTLGRTLRSKQETEWLVSELGQLTGLQAKSTAAGR